MKPLWKVRSGNFAGWRSNDLLYDGGGNNVGYFKSDVAYSTKGYYIGEIYRDDWIGKKTSGGHSLGRPHAAHAGIAQAAHAGRAGLAIAGWEDPEF